MQQSGAVHSPEIILSRVRFQGANQWEEPAIRLQSFCWFTTAYDLLSCHPWPCMLLNLRFQADSNPSLSATVSNTYRSHLLFHLPFNANAVTFLLATAISAIAAVP